MIQTIVFAADLRVFTSHISQHLLTLSQAHQARVVVHAVEPLGSFGQAVVNTYLPKETSQAFQAEQVGPVLANQVTQRRIGIIQRVPGVHPIEDVVVAQARPADLILAIARERSADLILMGSHSPKDDCDFSLGSVTNRVLQLSRVPVYMVPMLSSFPSRWLSGHLPQPAA